MQKIILSISVNDTRSQVTAYRQDGSVATVAAHTLHTTKNDAGWLTQNPIEIIDCVRKELVTAAETVGLDSIEAVSICTSPDTIVLWDRQSGQPIYPALIQNLELENDASLFTDEVLHLIHQRTGAFVNSSAAATKIRWIIKSIPAAQSCLQRGTLKYGTLETWLIWNLSNHIIYATEASHASKSLLFNVCSHMYDNDLLELFQIPASVLPQIRGSDSMYGTISHTIFGREVPIMGVISEQAAGLFAYTGFKRGSSTTSLDRTLRVLTSTGSEFKTADTLITAVLGSLHGETFYSLESTSDTVVPVISWLRDGLKVISSIADMRCWNAVTSSADTVFIIPGTGSSSPITISGITAQSSSSHIVKAAMDTIAFQTQELTSDITATEPIASDLPFYISDDQAKNPELLQLYADILGRPIVHTLLPDSNSFGAAAVAALSCGFWDEGQINQLTAAKESFQPRMSREKADELLTAWKKAVSSTG